MCVSAHDHTDIPMLHFQNDETLCIEGDMCGLVHTIKQIFQCYTFKNINAFCLEGGMGASTHASNVYSNSPPSKTLKPSAWKEACVLVHTLPTDIPMLHLQKH